MTNAEILESVGTACRQSDHDHATGFLPLCPVHAATAIDVAVSLALGKARDLLCPECRAKIPVNRDNMHKPTGSCCAMVPCKATPVRMLMNGGWN